MEADDSSREIVLELRLILGHPAAMGELLAWGQRWPHSEIGSGMQSFQVHVEMFNTTGICWLRTSAIKFQRLIS